MEELGRIDINIRDSSGGGGGGGGGGGSGSTGGGPSRPAPPPMPSTGGAGGSGWFDKLVGLSNLKGELSGFMSSPSLSGIQDIMSAESATSGALASLGVSATAAAAAIPVFGVAVIAVSAALSFMSQAADKIRDRIEAIGRFSGTLTIAMATERIAELNRKLREVSQNATTYAQVQRYETAAKDAAAETQIQLNKVYAWAAAIWHRLMLAVHTVIRPFVVLAGIVADVNMWVASMVDKGVEWMGSMLDRYVMPTFNAMTSSISSALESAFGGNAFYEWLKWALGEIMDQLGIISKPKIQQNQWAIADLQAMTGRRY